MKHLLLLLVAGICFCSNAQSIQNEYPESIQLKLTNPLKTSRENILVVVSPDQLKKATGKFNSKAFVVLDGAQEIPSQYNHKDSDQPGVAFVVDKLNGLESRAVEIRFHPSASISRPYPKLTQAELSHKIGGAWENREYMAGTFKNVDYLRVPPEHKDHSWFIRYEGPGWESDKVGYRFYLDQRNATDVFGKKTRENVLQHVGLDGFDSYHNLQPWGMDVMKVGKSLGIGSIGAIADGKTIRVEKTDSVNCRIVENGNVFSSILTNYYGWQIADKKHYVRSRLSIHAGTRLTRELIDITNNAPVIATGIVKDKLGKLITDRGDASRWAYIATYGKQSLNADELGLVIFYKPSTAIGLSEDEFSHIVSLKPAQGKVEYYFAAAWSGEPDGIKDEASFVDYINQTAAELGSPVKVDVDSSRKK